MDLYADMLDSILNSTKNMTLFDLIIDNSKKVKKSSSDDYTI